MLRLLGAELRHDHREMAHTLRKPASSTTHPGPERRAAPVPRPVPAPRPARPPAGENRGCLFAIAQLPLIGFLAFIAILLLVGAVHDLFLL